MAQTVAELARGKQRLVERELEQNRASIRKKIKQVKIAITCLENSSAKKRYKAEEHRKNLLENIKNIVDSQSQTDPSFKTRRFSTQLSAAEVRKQLREKYGYSDKVLPKAETIRVKLNDLGYNLKRVAKVLPQKKYQKPKPSLKNQQLLIKMRIQTRVFYV